MSIREASPATLASVGVSTLIARCPGRGGPPFVPTSTELPLVARSLPSRRTSAITTCLPSCVNGTVATYTDFAASGSWAVVLLWNCGLTASDSERAMNGPLRAEPSARAV